MDEEKYAIEIESERFDCGSKIGLVKANIRFALQDKEIQKEILEYIENVVYNK